MSISTSLREINFLKEKTQEDEILIAQFGINISQDMIINPNHRSSSNSGYSMLSINRDDSLNDEYIVNIFNG